MSQLDKCLKFKSIQGDDYTTYKITPQNAIAVRHLSSCGTIVNTKESRDVTNCCFWKFMSMFIGEALRDLATTCNFARSSFEPCFAKMSVMFVHPVMFRSTLPCQKGFWRSLYLLSVLNGSSKGH